MISEEVNIYGYIKIPYPYLEEYLIEINNLKGKNSYKDFPDFISAPINCINNAMSSFSYTMRYEPQFEQTVIERFESFLAKIKFITSTLIVDIESKKYFFYEYVSDSTRIYKSENKVVPTSF
jgi:hypothetical protein